MLGQSIKIYLSISKQNLYRTEMTENSVPLPVNVHINTFNRSNVKSKTWIDVHARTSIMLSIYTHRGNYNLLISTI